MARILVAALLVLLPTVARAVVIGGGGSAGSDCLVAFDAPVNQPESKPRNYTCTDGAACDADGIVDGVCTFPLTVCANSTYNAASCNLVGVDKITVDHALDNGDEKFDTDFQALQNRIDNDIDPPNDDVDACTGAPVNIRIPIVGPFKNGAGANFCKKSVKKLKIVSTGIIAGKIVKDTDKIKMTCLPAPTGCDPTVLYAGTFDRIQNQIFNQSCAVSGCHDSQTHKANMLLETGASYDNLVDVIPDNDAAASAGWKRIAVIDAMHGDPETSLIVHKLDGTLPQGFGDRMPFGRRKLDQTLIDVITAWISAGAPQTGWVPGTD
jgi:hypothetical protein